jgi:hypothetical protein
VNDDPVDAVILAFLDHLEGSAPRPALDHLAEVDRQRAQEMLDGLTTARGIDPRASRPSVESLLMDTPLAGLLPTRVDVADPELGAVRRVLAGVDPRAHVAVDGGSRGASVVLSYLDLRARFMLVTANLPALSDQVRSQVRALFDADPDTSRIGVVATGSDELMTQIFSADDVANTVTTPRGQPHLRRDAPLPLNLAARRMLEQSAPEWSSFDFDHGSGEALDVASVAQQIARSIIERESARSYRGDKRRAYRALVGHENAFSDLVIRICAQASPVDLGQEITRLSQVAA